jgi:hypothetical protein
VNFRNYQGARGGILQMMAAATAPGGNTQMDALRDFAYLDHASQSARKSQADAGIAEDELAARGGLEEALGGVKTSYPGVDGRVLSTLFRASANPNTRDITQGVGDLGKANTQRLATDAAVAGDNQLANRLSAVLGEKTYEPYAIESGMGIDKSAGTITPTDVSTAQAGNYNASANNYNASAAHHAAGGRADDALAAQRGLLEASPGSNVFRVSDLNAPAQTPPSAPVSGDIGPAVRTMGEGPFISPEGPDDPSGVVGKLRRAMLSGAPPAGAAPAGPVAPVAAVPPNPGSGGGVNGEKPTTAGKTMAELEAQGYPPEIARGLAYKSMKIQADSMGMAKQIIDMAGNDGSGPQVVATFKGDRVVLTDYGKRLYAGGGGVAKTVRIRTPDGQTGTIPASELEAAKREGAVEVQ